MLERKKLRKVLRKILPISRSSLEIQCKEEREIINISLKLKDPNKKTEEKEDLEAIRQASHIEVKADHQETKSPL